jgi:hypothetical protein
VLELPISAFRFQIDSGSDVAGPDEARAANKLAAPGLKLQSAINQSAI